MEGQRHNFAWPRRPGRSKSALGGWNAGQLDRVAAGPCGADRHVDMLPLHWSEYSPFGRHSSDARLNETKRRLPGGCASHRSLVVRVGSPPRRLPAINVCPWIGFVVSQLPSRLRIRQRHKRSRDRHSIAVRKTACRAANIHARINEAYVRPSGGIQPIGRPPLVRPEAINNEHM